MKQLKIIDNTAGTPKPCSMNHVLHVQLAYDGLRNTVAIPFGTIKLCAYRTCSMPSVSKLSECLLKVFASESGERFPIAGTVVNQFDDRVWELEAKSVKPSADKIAFNLVTWKVKSNAQDFVLEWWISYEQIVAIQGSTWAKEQVRDTCV